MSPQRRTALVSVFAALVLIALKLVAGIHSGSLGLLSEAAHSGTDLVAALLTFFAIGVAGRPPDVGHPYGHGKAENLGALTEAAILVVAALVIAASSVFRLIEGGARGARRRLRAGVIGIVVVVDASRALRLPPGGPPLPERGIRHERPPFRRRPRGLACRPRRAARRARRLPRGRRDRGALRQRARPHRRLPADPGERRRAHGPHAVHSARGGARGDRGARARSAAAPAADAPRGRAPLRRRRHRGSRTAPRSSRATRRRTPSSGP